MKYMLGVKEEKRCKGQSLHLGVLVILFRELRHIRKESITLMVGGASLMVQWVKNLPAMQETQEMRAQSLGREDPLEEEMATLTGYCPKGRKELDTTEHEPRWTDRQWPVGHECCAPWFRGGSSTWRQVIWDGGREALKEQQDLVERNRREPQEGTQHTQRLRGEKRKPRPQASPQLDRPRTGSAKRV